MTLYVYFPIWIAELKRKLGSERGVETVEWVGMAAVVLALIGAIAAVMGGAGGTSIGEAIASTIAGWINSMAGGE